MTARVAGAGIVQTAALVWAVLAILAAALSISAVGIFFMGIAAAILQVIALGMLSGERSTHSRVRTTD